MLPNWLYGKSKSKLQEILGGGGGGGGTSYTAGDGIDISNGVISFDPETTPAINSSKIDGLDDDLAVLAPKTALSNPNLLDNPWFTVNQRGATTYDGTTEGQYTVDRWKLTIANRGTITVTDNGITLSANNSTLNPIFRQFIEKTIFDSLKGKTVTLSIMLANGSIRSETATIPLNPVIDNPLISCNIDGILYARLYYHNDSTGRGMLNIVKNASETLSYNIRAVKLELGSVSTLAMDTAPNYTTELLKCQRYFHKYATETLRPTNMYDCVPEMRATPTKSTITIDGTIYYVNSAEL